MKIYELISRVKPERLLIGDCYINPDGELINELIDELKFNFNKLNEPEKASTINEIRLYELDDNTPLNDDDDLMTYVYGTDYTVVFSCN